jgi:hypothetical protein
MDFLRFNLKLWASVVFTAGALAHCSAQTQPSDGSVIFSKPVDNGAGPASSLELPDATSGQPFRGLNAGPSEHFPLPQVDANTALQKELEDRKNWTLMTPEEIMGVQTPEQIFGLTEQDPDKNLSPEERYLKRQEKAETAAETNALGGANGWEHKDLGLFDRPDTSDPFSPQYKQTDSSTFSRIFNPAQNSLFGQKSASSKMASVSSSSMAKEAKEEEEEMARFRALIGEVPPPSLSPTPALPVASPSLQPLSQFDALGHPVESKESDLSKPNELTTLARFTGQYTPPKKIKKPSWEPQAPPWLSDGSTPPTTPPVRKFY